MDDIHVIFITRSNKKSPLPGTTVTLGAGLTNSAINEIQDFLNKQNFKFIYSSYNLFDKILEGVRAFKICEIHDVMHLRQQAFEEMGYSAPYQTTKADEIASLSAYDAIICINTNEEKYLKENSLTNVKYIPPNFSFNANVSGPNSKSFGIIGSAAKPNIDGFEFYKTQILNLEQVVIAGALSSNIGKVGYSSKNISLLGVVRNVVEFYKKVDISLAPVRFGGGLKIKAIEAIAHGKPVFGTKHSLSGFPEGIEQVSIAEDRHNKWNVNNMEALFDIKKSTIKQYVDENFSDLVCSMHFDDLLR
ncbi:glycosyltransferase [Stappia sp. F7233]|uniref:Glycosyltransferase n=1 Tax=Stappia albiluteola TaxID=2758565 RepID=A0A839AJJ3_9HYPH|nr:glycosyltransferase [Stappia albiluteola]